METLVNSKKEQKEPKSGQVPFLSSGKGSSFSERLRELIGNKSGRAFAKEAGISYSTLHNYLTDTSLPTLDNLIALANYADVSVQWLATGQGDPKSTKANQDISGVTMVNSFSSINVSAGYGSFNEGVTQPDGQVPYSAELLHKLGVKPRHGAVFWADGVSMRPTIDDGDQMLVDLSKKEIKGDKIYLVQNGASVWVKRLKINWDGLELISDNKDEYPPIRLTQAEAEDLQVIGQVVHIGKNLT
ncbi:MULTISPECIES: XRE family transcriptional regulator [Pasteurellaceae]|uniref:XRE family transcriptional regulator n=1 Tax=Pasteurellaceae TaxID=712 RepID=UPI0029257D76|nr:transcriptional repressor [uncultured phage]